MKRIHFPLFFFVSLFVIGLGSCTSVAKISYFQDVKPGMEGQIEVPLEVRLRPNDKISIIVNSKDAELSNLFNLPVVSQRIGMSAGTSLNYGAQQISGYTVDDAGEIDFPVIGKIQVAGLTRMQIAAHVKQTLINEDLVKDPVVTVEFMNLGFSVIGEVNRPGRYVMDRDKITLLDAISMAGDLTIYGKRDAVYVLRDENGKQVSYCVDLSSIKNIFASPVYFLQQDDVVYVVPNAVRIRQSTVNGNNVRSTSFWMSLTSLLITTAVLFKK